MIDMERLNDHSRQFGHRFFKEWPQWIRYARFDPYEDFEREALLIEIPRPVDGSAHGLFITTSEWEVSVGYGENFHTRFGTSGEVTTSENPDFYDQAIAFIHDFVDEQVVLATAYENNEWLGAWKIDLRSEKIEDIVVEPGVVVKISSWLGTWDRIVKN